jgi:hypothetical protein
MMHFQSILKVVNVFDLLVKRTNTIYKELIFKERKQCSKCKLFKRIEEFKDPSLKSGVGRICNSCKEKRPIH